MKRSEEETKLISEIIFYRKKNFSLLVRLTSLNELATDRDGVWIPKSYIEDLIKLSKKGTVYETK
jgi:hypothetical protein